MKFNKHYILIIFFVVIAVVFSYIYNQSNFVNKWKRFTYKDGVVLYEICKNNKKVDIEKLYGNRQTDFRNYLENYGK